MQQRDAMYSPQGPGIHYTVMEIANFLHDRYRRHNQRRQEHLATLGLPLAGRTVLEVGAGIGDHTSFFLDRGCRVTVTDAREDLLGHVRARYPEVEAFALDLDAEESTTGLPRHDIVYAYGILYHLARPDRAIERLAVLTGSLLLVETCVSPGIGVDVGLLDENASDPTQAMHGTGCRPTRPWVMENLKRHFPHVYNTRTQPWHEEFPLDWNAPATSTTGLYRSVFVASRSALASDRLLEGLVDKHTRE